MKPFVIGINGPPQIGKGWLAGNIAHLMPYHCRIMSLAEPLREEILFRMKWKGTYPDFKKFIFADGESGRDKLIAYGLKKREENPIYWVDRLVKDIRFADPTTPVIIIDDLGFFNEQEHLAAHADALMTIVMAPTHYSIGCIFEGDSRVCLSPKNGFRTIDSNSALAAFKERLENAASFQSIDSAKRRLWFSALMERSLVE